MTAIILHPDQERILSRTLRAERGYDFEETRDTTANAVTQPPAPSAKAALTLDDGTVLQCTFSPHPLWGIVQGVDDYAALKGHITSLDFAPPIDLHPAVFRIARAVINESGPISQWHTEGSYWVKCAR